MSDQASEATPNQAGVEALGLARQWTSDYILNVDRDPMTIMRIADQAEAFAASRAKAAVERCIAICEERMNMARGSAEMLPEKMEDTKRLFYGEGYGAFMSAHCIRAEFATLLGGQTP